VLLLFSLMELSGGKLANYMSELSSIANPLHGKSAPHVVGQSDHPK
jgi:hypothetical protein